MEFDLDSVAMREEARIRREVFARLGITYPEQDADAVLLAQDSYQIELADRAMLARGN